MFASILIWSLIIPYNILGQALAQKGQNQEEIGAAPPGTPTAKKEVERKKIEKVSHQYDTFTLIDDDYQAEKIDLDKKIRYYAYALLDKDKLDKKYYSDQVAEDLTTVILEMRTNWASLKSDVKKELAEYGVTPLPDRPESRGGVKSVGLFDHSGGSAGCGGPVSLPALDFSLSSSHFMLHYTTFGPHAVPLDDISPANGIPDYVEIIRDNLEASWAVNNANLWRSPRPDGVIGGGVNLIDFYFYDTVSLGVAVPESGDPSTTNQNDAIGYSCLDNNLPTLPFDLRQVSAAHEFHHLVQFAYNAVFDSSQAGWMFESTAQWFEDEAFDGNDDYVNLIPEFLSATDLNLISTVGLHEYGAAIWHRFVSDQYGDTVVRRTWEFTGAHSPGVGPRFSDNTRAIEEVTQTGAWREAFYSFVINNSWIDGFDIDRGSNFRAEEANLWPAEFDAQTAVYTGTPVTISDNDATLQGGGADYIFSFSTASDMKVTFDGQDNGNWMVTLALFNSGIPGTDLQVIDFTLSTLTKSGSITVRSADIYGDIEVYIRNQAEPVSTVNQGWIVTFSPP